MGQHTLSNGSPMHYSEVEIQIDLNDPERGFEFVSDGQSTLLSFRDWQDMLVTVEFSTPYYFCVFWREGYKGVPEGRALEIVGSEFVSTFFDDGYASSDEVLHHYILSTNEGQWCEVVATGIKVRSDQNHTRTL